MPRRIVDLNGDDWLLSQSPAWSDPLVAKSSELEQAGPWLQATVPGNVQADLHRAGRLPDLFFGVQSQAAQWVNDCCWWLTREFPLQRSPGERAHLVLRGVDYISTLFLNGHSLGRHEGMFSSQVHEVTGLLESHNRLAVHALGARWLPRDRSTRWGRFLNHIEARVGGLPGQFPHRRDTLKCQMGFGWDFAPTLCPLGIWDDVYLIITDQAFIRDVVAQPRMTADGVALEVTVEIDACRAGSWRLRSVLTGETFEARPLVTERPADVGPGMSHHRIEIQVPEPRLWWPWDHGQPDLYRLTVEIWAGDRLLDSVALCMGLRSVDLDRWTLRVNGRPVYARGANWVPADILPGRVTTADYSTLLNLARQANMNCLRVWGGGLREKQAFYDLCDRLGILVWQEFPFAGAFLTHYPHSPEYLSLVKAESSSIVRDLRNHPSIVLWCGGNEFQPQRNRLLVRTLRQVIAENDATRPFLPASPSEGDHHNWQVWHHFLPPSAYRDDKALFASEFGLQAPSSVETLRRFLPPEELWPPGSGWTHHGAQLDKLHRYVRPLLKGHDPTLNRFAEASQRAQAYGLQIAIEHFRRQKAFGCGGVLVWQLNEPWPAISWSIIDFYRTPKPAYEVVCRSFSPCLISLAFALKRYRPGDLFCADVWIINDRGSALPACLIEVALWDQAGHLAARSLQQVDVPGNSAGPIGGVQWNLPAGDRWQVTCQLTQEGQTQSTNQYDLSVYDGIMPTPGQRLGAWLGRLVTES